MTQVEMIPFTIEATIQYPQEIVEFLDNNRILSDDRNLLIEEKSTGNTFNPNFVSTFNGRKDVFVRTSDQYLSFLYLNGYNEKISKSINIDLLKINQILSFKPTEITSEDDRFVFVISFQESTIVNSITEAFKDQISAIEDCSLSSIGNVIRDIMINNQDMKRFTYSDVKFDAYSQNHKKKELHGLCSVSGQEVWFKIRCFKCN